MFCFSGILHMHVIIKLNQSWFLQSRLLLINRKIGWVSVENCENFQQTQKNNKSFASTPTWLDVCWNELWWIWLWCTSKVVQMRFFHNQIIISMVDFAETETTTMMMIVTSRNVKQKEREENQNSVRGSWKTITRIAESYDVIHHYVEGSTQHKFRLDDLLINFKTSQIISSR